MTAHSEPKGVAEKEAAHDDRVTCAGCRAVIRRDDAVRIEGGDLTPEEAFYLCKPCDTQTAADIDESMRRSMEGA